MSNLGTATLGRMEKLFLLVIKVNTAQRLEDEAFLSARWSNISRIGLRRHDIWNDSRSNHTIFSQKGVAAKHRYRICPCSFEIDLEPTLTRRQDDHGL